MQKISLGIGIWLVVLLFACDDTSKKPGKVQDTYVEDMTQEDSLIKEDMKIKDMIVVDMLPTEPNPCETDSQCFEGRICLAGQCAPAECKSSIECPADRPICIGRVDENDQIQRGRCGNCLENTDCYEPATCQPFNEGIKGGVCVSSDSCQGTLDCPPAARNVMRGIQDPVC